MENSELYYQINQLLESNSDSEIAPLLVDIHGSDIAELFKLFDAEERERIFRVLPSEVAATVLPELDDYTEKSISEKLDDLVMGEIIQEMPLDDAVDVLGDLEVDFVAKVLNALPVEDAFKIQKLLKYHEDTAGGIMNSDFISLREDMTVDQAIEKIREEGVEEDKVFYHFITNGGEELRGILSVNHLLFSNPHTQLRKIMDSDVIKANVNDDQELVAEIVSKYNLISLPVVDDANHLLGIISIDDVIDVIESEVNEDISRMTGVHKEETLELPILRSIQLRLPWLLATLIGGLISTGLIKTFQGTLNQVIALAFFFPLINGMGGNVGTQCSSLTIRGIATGDINFANVRDIIFKQIRVGMLLGLICGSVVGLVAVFFFNDTILGWRLAIIVGIAMSLAITVAATTGTLFPLLFNKLDIDPALASGPFVTTSNDITGLIIYLGLATWFIIKFL